MYPSIYYPLYTYLSKPRFLHDGPANTRYFPSDANGARKNMLFHVAAGDYIATLATIIRFFEETIYDEKTTPEMRALQLKIMKGLRNDLLYLDKHFKITPKDSIV